MAPNLDILLLQQSKGEVARRKLKKHQKGKRKYVV
jgi:hypothetical protein